MKNQPSEPNNKQTNKIINKILNIKKIKSSMKNFLKNIAQEGREYKEMTQILHNFIKTGKVTKEDSKKVYTQLLDTLKLGGSAGIWLIPGGSVLLIILVKLAAKWHINLLPTSFKKK